MKPWPNEPDAANPAIASRFQPGIIAAGSLIRNVRQTGYERFKTRADPENAAGLFWWPSEAPEENCQGPRRPTPAAGGADCTCEGSQGADRKGEMNYAEQAAWSGRWWRDLFAYRGQWPSATQAERYA
jgi:hypothetical protein